jgi:hypothetical protein
VTRKYGALMRLRPWHKRAVYAVGALTLVSGLGWLIDHYLLAGVAEFGEPHGAFELWWLRLHGAAIMAGLVVLGSLLPGHVAGALRAGENLRSGLSMLGLAVFLTATGYGLYYVGDENVRSWISALHWLAGLAAGVALPLHLWFGKRRRKRHGAGAAARVASDKPLSAAVIPRGAPAQPSVNKR